MNTRINVSLLEYVKDFLEEELWRYKADVGMLTPKDVLSIVRDAMDAYDGGAR